MGLFNLKNSEAKKREKQANIAKWNEHIKKCAQTNRIAQIKHLEDYLQFPSFDSDIVMAKLICVEKDDGSHVTRNTYVDWYDKFGFKSDSLKLPIDRAEAQRVFFKIIPFFVAIDDEYNRNWWLQQEKWNHGSDYDCDDSYDGRIYVFDYLLGSKQEKHDSSIKSENDVFVQKHEIQYLPDQALLFLNNLIQSWKENNYAEIVGDYVTWKNKKDFLVSYEDMVSKEIDKRGLMSIDEKCELDETDEFTNYGAKGEQDVEYALKWLPNEYRRIQRTNDEGVRLHNTLINDESQEIDHIVVAPNGVFLIETKYLKGNITIDTNGNWSREVDGVLEGARNPVQQVDRHYSIVSSILDGFINKEDIHNIICLAYDTCTISGIENSPVTVVKSDMLARHILNCQSIRKYSESDIETIIEKIEQHRL